MAADNTARLDLGGAWTLQYGPDSPSAPGDPAALAAANLPRLPAVVPGNVELSLLEAGLVPPLEVGNNIYRLRPWEHMQWWYSRRFTAPPAVPAGSRLELVFEGLDCLATIWLNGVAIGSADNMLIPHRFDVTAAVRAGENEIVVRLASAVRAGQAHCPDAVEAGGESLSVRKAPHMYGWDIMPRVVSAGIWRDAYIETVPATRIRSVYWATLAAVAGLRTAKVMVDWDFATDRVDIDGLSVRITLQRARAKGAQPSEAAALLRLEVPAISTHGRQYLDLTDVDLWWPRGLGEPALYDASVELIDGGATLARHHCRIGIRTAQLQRTDITTPEGGEFVFVVNGERVFCKGTNWVPLDALHSRDLQHLDAAFGMLVDLNCNMVRCWGGNVYEHDRFFDLCDRSGIMVWQDFAMACAIYPQGEEFAARLAAEAAAVITRLRNRASLVLWAGNNEIDQAYGWWCPGLDPNTDTISRRVLPEAVRRLDWRREYMPSSPYISPEAFRRGQVVCPEQHLWGPRDDFKGPFYTRSAAHFVSEIGYHGCPDRRTLEQFLEPGHLWPWQGNDRWLTHAVRPLRGMTGYDYRIALMARQITTIFAATPDNLDDFILASQISQAEANKFFIEMWRLGKWRKTGILWWNLRDGWPIFSDAVVDYYGRRKLAYEYIRRVQADVCVMAGEPRGGRCEIAAANDTRRPAAGWARVTDAATGAVLLEADFSVPANGRAAVGSIPAATTQQMWRLEWTLADGTRGINHYLAGPRPFNLSDYRRWLKAIDVAWPADKT